MPIMDGMEATKIIREEKIAENTPIVALTASADNSQQKICSEWFLFLNN